MKKLKDIVLTILGSVIIFSFLYVIGRYIYESYFSDGLSGISVVKSVQVKAPLSNVLFWHEYEIEKTDHLMSKISSEKDNMINPLFSYLKNKGFVTEKIETLSLVAKQKMIENGAYAIPKDYIEPTSCDIAQQKGYYYIFKVMIHSVICSRTNDLESVGY